MKILHIVPYWYPQAGGGISLIYNVSKHLINAGHDIGILTPNISNIDKKGLKIYTVPQIVSILGINPIVYRLRSALKKLQKNYDIILIHSYIYEMNSRVVLYHKLGIVGIPVVLYFHGGLNPDMNPYIGWKVRLSKRIYDPIFGRLCFKYSTHIISVSKQDIPLIIKKFNINSNKITYIPNGVESNAFYRKKHEKLRIVFIARLTKWKGIDFFAHIVKSLPSTVDFLVVGDGPQRNNIKALSRRYNNVKWMGGVSHDKIPEVLAISDIFILPSYTEASPSSCLEASATGIPSVVFSVGDIPNILPDDCGFKIKPYDIDDFCNKLIYLIENESLRKNMGRNARKFVKERLDYKEISNLLKITLENILIKTNGGI